MVGRLYFSVLTACFLALSIAVPAFSSSTIHFDSIISHFDSIISCGNSHLVVAQAPPGARVDPGERVAPGQRVAPGERVAPGGRVPPGQKVVPGAMVEPGAPIEPGARLDSGERMESDPVGPEQPSAQPSWFSSTWERVSSGIQRIGEWGLDTAKWGAGKVRDGFLWGLNTTKWAASKILEETYNIFTGELKDLFKFVLIAIALVLSAFLLFKVACLAFPIIGLKSVIVGLLLKKKLAAFLSFLAPIFYKSFFYKAYLFIKKLAIGELLKKLFVMFGFKKFFGLVSSFLFKFFKYLGLGNKAAWLATKLVNLLKWLVSWFEWSKKTGKPAETGKE